MEWTGLNELREKYLSFFEKKGHFRLESASLVPLNDNSLLLINSGMAPLKKYFLNQQKSDYKRVTSCQKCIRTPDIENVGKTSRHGTFFEMLGNFSFGDYFKEDSIKWAWEFLTKDLRLPVDKLWVSIYLDDDEAFDIWSKEVKIPTEKIVRLGKKDNFWEIGSGPCGPCSEIYFDRGEQYACDRPDCAVGCDCDRYVEFWNIVFSEFNTDGKGNYSPMEKKNIDTGMGLERLACIMQGVDNLFEVDTIKNIMAHISKISNVNYLEDSGLDISLRVITDHIRSIVFMIVDGIIPSNEGRGYVLRRLLRRACRHGRILGIKKPFLFLVCETVIKENEKAYPELTEKQQYIKKVVQSEEEKFEKTIDQGMVLIDSIIADMKSNGESIFLAEHAFKLYDTFGFPLDLTKEIALENNFNLDEDGFNVLMKGQKDTARNARANNFDSWIDSKEVTVDLPATHFCGYDVLDCESKIEFIFNNGSEVDVIDKGDVVSLILDKTPFYAEGGGQCADNGRLVLGQSVIEIFDCKKDDKGHYIHHGKCIDGTFNLGDTVCALVDSEKRLCVMANHTAAHLLQAALINVLGDHVNQAGQSVDFDIIRFDFTHFSAMKNEEIDKVELLVNEYIFKSYDVVAQEMDIEKAKEKGAIALFGEKYGKIVRVLNIGDGCSVEFCGGTHVYNTSQIGIFRICSEFSVASGVRRIEAVCRKNAYLKMKQDQNLISSVSNLLKSNVHDIERKLNHTLQLLKSKDKEILSLNSKLAFHCIQDIYDKKEVLNNSVGYIFYVFKDQNLDVVKSICDNIKEKDKETICVIVIDNVEKSLILVSCGKDVKSRGYHAGKIVKEIAALVNGKGGGREDFATAGISDAKLLLDKKEEIKNILNSFSV